MMRIRHLVPVLILGTVVAPCDLAAQGALSTQGFGYPTGQVSTRVRATGGSLGEFDPDTPLNPAAIGTVPEGRMFLQYEPELRRLRHGNDASNTVTARFSLGALSARIGERGRVGISVATLLDRSTQTSISYEQEITGQVLDIMETTQVAGAINDVRLSAAYTVHPAVQIGFGGHILTGQNRVSFFQQFPDTLKFNSLSQTSDISFRGFAASAGIVARPSSKIGIALSGRKGFDLDARSGDSILSSAKAPDRVGAAFSFEGIPGASIAVHGSRDFWSRMNGLGTTNTEAVDTWSGGAGLETLGPRLAARQTVLRLGARYAGLPFKAAGGEVKEIAFGGGVGAQFFRNRAMLDFAVERASRSVDAPGVDVKEHGYIFSFGLRIRP